MRMDKFQLIGDSLSGRGLSIDVAVLIAPEQKLDPTGRGTRLVEVAEVAYREGRMSALLSWDDRFDLSCAVDALRALAVEPSPTGDRHRRAADVIARLLQDQEGST